MATIAHLANRLSRVMDNPFPAESDLFPICGPWRDPEGWRQGLGEHRFLSPWLAETGSLTQALRQACLEGLSLQIHRRLFVPLPENVSPLLGRPSNEAVRQREVWLLCGQTRVVFARSWIPEGVLADPGEYPLGDRLFEAGTQAERIRLEVAPVTTPEGNIRWARRSLHWTPWGGLLVGEVFLPGMECLCTRVG